MTSTCTRQTRRSATPRVVVAGVVPALALAPSTAAFAQSEAPSTIRALIGGDGSVSEVERLGGDGGEAAASDLPVTLAISRSVDGDTTTTNYEVENTTATTQAVDYVDAAGNPGTAAQDVALPLVAQLAVRLPSSRTDVEASGARITKLADGTTELVWSLVLFSPIGSPQQDVSFSAKGEGEPLARLDAMAVSPSGSPGLAATSQAANAVVNGNGILNVVATGANDGLLKLSDGVGQLLEGLNKLEAGAKELNAGLGGTAAPGAQKLADGGAELQAGLKTAADGSKQLSDGLGAAATGGGTLSGGLDQLNAGGAQLAAGLTTLNTSVAPLGSGSAELAAGGAKIAAGLGDLKAGVDSLPESIQANPGYQQLKGALAGVQAGIGVYTDVATPTTANPTLLGALNALKFGMRNPAGESALECSTVEGRPDTCAIGDIAERVSLALGAAAASDNDGLKGLIAVSKQVYTKAGCPPGPAEVPVPGYLPPTLLPAGSLCQDAATVLYGLALPADHPLAPDSPKGGVLAQTEASKTDLGVAAAGLKKAYQGIDGLVLPTLTKVQGGLSNPGCDLTKPTDPANPCGVKEIQGLVSAGIDQLIAGISAALSPGVTQLADGSQTLAAGQKSVADSAGPLLAGILQLKDGSQTLSAGLGTADKGGQDLLAGLNLLNAGGKQLSDGLPAAVDGAGQIADGAQLLADGLGDAADGSGLIADGLGSVVEGETAVAQGLTDLREQAIGVLQSQFAQGTTLARQQLAGLEASTDLITETPGAASTTWVLTQSTSDIGFQTVSSESGMNDLGRNAALAAGAALLLMAGVAGGFLSGRRNAVAAAHAAAPTE